MNAQQTEAQRLADELVALHGYPLSIKAAAELRRLDEKCEALIGDAVRETRQIHRIAVLEAANEQLLKALGPDRQLLQQALDAMRDAAYDEDGYTINADLAEAHDALAARLAQCDRCGKKLGGEGDIHTCTPLEQKSFEQWWDAGNDIPNDGPWTHDTPIQFAWAGWQAALAQPKQEGDIHTCRPDPIGDAQDRLIAELAAQPEQKPVAIMRMLHTYGDTTPPAAQPEQEFLMEPEGRCKECLTYNGHQDGCSHATPPAAQPAPVQPEQEPVHYGPSASVFGLAEMILSDCGCSSNYQPLLNRVAARIIGYIDTPPAAAQRQPLEPVVPKGKEIYHLPAFRLGWKTAEAAHNITGENT
jgi:hypothetical protein